MVSIQVSAAAAKVLTRMAPKHEAGERVGLLDQNGGVSDASLTGIYKGYPLTNIAMEHVPFMDDLLVFTS
jgi:hypothetical protein